MQQTTKVDTSEKLKVGWTPSTELPDKKKCVSRTRADHFRFLIHFTAIRTGTTNKLLEGKRGRPGESSKLAALCRKAKLGKGRRR